MGLVKHDAIVVTSGIEERAVAARKLAVSLGLECTPIAVSKANGYASFLIIPDGSKEGWEQSDLAESARKDFCKIVQGVYWVHVAYSYDLDLVKIVGNNVLNNS